MQISTLRYHENYRLKWPTEGIKKLEIALTLRDNYDTQAYPDQKSWSLLTP